MQTLAWLLLSVVIFIIDQITKLLAVKFLIEQQPVTVFPGFNLDLTFNQGAAFGMLADSSGWQQVLFIVVTLVVSAAIILWLQCLDKAANRLEAWSLTLILAGALGNLLDRVRLSYVIDFIDVYYKNWHWYTFNIADSAITLGVMLLIYVTLRPKRK